MEIFKNYSKLGIIPSAFTIDDDLIDFQIFYSTANKDISFFDCTELIVEGKLDREISIRKIIYFN